MQPSLQPKQSRQPQICLSQKTKTKTIFFQQTKNEIYSQEAKDSGPWAKKESWEKIEKNLTRVQVRRFLATSSGNVKQ